MNRQRVYREVWGVAVGDIVRTSYNTGPYEVWGIAGPEKPSAVWPYINKPWPDEPECIYLLCVEPGCESPRDGEFSYLNDLIRTPDGRLITWAGRSRYYTGGEDRASDEVFVTKAAGHGVQLALELSA